jgi:hypothetical protein
VANTSRHNMPAPHRRWEIFQAIIWDNKSDAPTSTSCFCPKPASNL